MAIFSLAVRTSNVVSGNASLEIIAGTNNAYKLLEFGLTLNAATISTFGLGQPAAIGLTPTTPVTVLAEDNGNTTAGNANTALAWGTGPTAPTAFYRRVSLPGTIGAGIIWTFPRGITILKAKSLVQWNLVAPSVTDTWVVVDE